MIKTISAKELKALMESDGVVLIDVREASEHGAEHIEGAHLIPLSMIGSKKLPRTTKSVVIHCQSGKRSQEACQKLLAQNPALDISSLEGGISAWKACGFPVERSAGCGLSIERQTQFVAGFLAFLGVVLGAWLHPLFYGLSGFVGLGLMFAGLTGWCGMAQFLRKMPWNS